MAIIIKDKISILVQEDIEIKSKMSTPAHTISTPHSSQETNTDRVNPATGNKLWIVSANKELKWCIQIEWDQE